MEIRDMNSAAAISATQLLLAVFLFFNYSTLFICVYRGQAMSHSSWLAAFRLPLITAQWRD